jgi:hypothetical protein
VILIFTLTSISPVGQTVENNESDINNDSHTIFTQSGHVTSSIWNFKNVLNKPDSAILININKYQWEVLAAVCAVPVFIGRTHNVPILISDDSDGKVIDIKYNSKNIAGWGTDSKSATEQIALEYWSSAEIAFTVENYEHALWIVPSASFLSAPILVSPSQDTIDKLGTKCIISIGNLAPDVKVPTMHKLESKSDVWSFQIELYDTKGFQCNYVIITNPHDTADNLNENIKWPYLSIAAAPLSAYRRALVQTGDYTAIKEPLEEFNKAQEKIDSVYADAKPYFRKVKDDSYSVEKYLIDRGHKPEYIAIVGGAFSVPDYYFDIHTEYKYWDQILHYVPSMSPYANLSAEYPTNITVKEDLGVGRIVAHSILDATSMLMKTFHYSEFMTGGEYSSLFPSSWEKRSAVVDGHRLNQPRDGGPPDEISTRPYFPGGNILDIQSEENFEANYFLPRNNSDPQDDNPTVDTILNNLEEISLVQVMAHGGSMTNAKSVWFEGGYDPDNPAAGERRLYVTARDILKKDLTPSLYYFIACHTAHIYLEQEMEDYFPLAFIHSGAVAFIGPVTCQAICFWYKAPYGPASTQAMYFWENILEHHMVLGPALAKAKWDAYQDWVKDYPNDQRIEPDGPAFHIFGDPALQLYTPKHKIETPKEMDIDIQTTNVISGEKFSVKVSLNDLSTGNQITNSQIKITYNGQIFTGNSATFTAQTEPGDYPFLVDIQANGYPASHVSTWISIEKPVSDDQSDSGNNFMLLFSIVIVVIVIIGVAAFISNRYKN